MKNYDLTNINTVISGKPPLEDTSADIMAQLLMDDNHSTYRMFERIATKYINNPELRDGIDFTLTELVGYNTAELAKKIVDYNLEHTSDGIRHNEHIYTIEYTSDDIEDEKYLPFFVTAANPEEARKKAESIITKHFWRFDITNVSLGMKHKIGEDDFDKNFTDLKVLSKIDETNEHDLAMIKQFEEIIYNSDKHFNSDLEFPDEHTLYIPLPKDLTTKFIFADETRVANEEDFNSTHLVITAFDDGSINWQIVSYISGNTLDIPANKPDIIKSYIDGYVNDINPRYDKNLNNDLDLDGLE